MNGETETVRGVVIWDADSDQLLDTASLEVVHEGRTRRLELRVARGTIRDQRVTETPA